MVFGRRRSTLLLAVGAATTSCLVPHPRYGSRRIANLRSGIQSSMVFEFFVFCEGASVAMRIKLLQPAPK
jgi:hypothetical protein